MGAVAPGETLGTLYNIHVGSNKTKQHTTPTAPSAHPTYEAKQMQDPTLNLG